jgi:hypothetical protein
VRKEDAVGIRKFSDEGVVVVDDAFEVVGTVVELPQLLVNGCLVVQYADDEFLANILAGTGSILQDFF